MAAKIWSTMHHTMPDCGWLSLFVVCEKCPDTYDRILLVSETRRFANQRRAVRVFDPEPALAVPDRLGLARD